MGLTPGPFALYFTLQQHQYDEFHPVRRGNERQDNIGKAITRLSHIDFISSRHLHPRATHCPTSYRRPTLYNCRYSTTLRPGALVVSTISVAGLVRGLFATGFPVIVVSLLCGNDHLAPLLSRQLRTPDVNLWHGGYRGWIGTEVGEGRRWMIRMGEVKGRWCMGLAFCLFGRRAIDSWSFTTSLLPSARRIYFLSGCAH